MIRCDPQLLAAAAQALGERAAEQRRATEYPPMLSPVQAWLLGHIDRPTLLDRVIGLEDSELKAQIGALGRAQGDESYAAMLVAQAQDAIDAWMEGAPGQPGDLSFREYLAMREAAQQNERHAARLTRADGSLISPAEIDGLLAGEEALRGQGSPEMASELHGVRERLIEAVGQEAETPQESAYGMYEAATDAFDEAQLLAQEAEGQAVQDQRTERARDFTEARDDLGLTGSDEQENDLEAER